MDLNNGNVDFFSIEPPRLEDAGLEDPALPIEGIQEAFKRAADLARKNNTLRNIIPYNDEETENVDSDDTKKLWKLPIDLSISTMMPHEGVIVDPPHHIPIVDPPRHIPVVILDQTSVKETCTSDKTKVLARD